MKIISKIESQEGIDNIDEIIEEEEEQSNGPQKTITYYNSSTLSVTDKLAFTLDTSTPQGNGILIGFSFRQLVYAFLHIFLIYTKDFEVVLNESFK